MSEPVEILLVEDNADDVALTLNAFTAHHLGNRIHVARDGEEALEFLFGRGADPRPHPRLVLLDLKLPKIDGLQVLQKIKEDQRTRSIPVVVLTSSKEERDIVESYRLGVNSYIAKPVDFDQFIEAIRLMGMYWLLVNTSPLSDSVQFRNRVVMGP